MQTKWRIKWRGEGEKANHTWLKVSSGTTGGEIYTWDCWRQGQRCCRKTEEILHLPLFYGWGKWVWLSQEKTISSLPISVYKLCRRPFTQPQYWPLHVEYWCWLFFLCQELQVGTLVEITVIQDHTPVATPLLRGDLQVLVETKSYLRLSRQKALDLNAPIKVGTQDITLGAWQSRICNSYSTGPGIYGSKPTWVQGKYTPADIIPKYT